MSIEEEEEEFKEFLKYSNSPPEPCPSNEHRGEYWGFGLYYCTKCRRWLSKKGGRGKEK